MCVACISSVVVCICDYVWGIYVWYVWGMCGVWVYTRGGVFDLYIVYIMCVYGMYAIYVVYGMCNICVCNGGVFCIYN